MLKSDDKYLFTLSELARRFNRSEEFFLTLGCDDLINLMIKVPPDVTLGLTNASGHVGTPNMMRIPHFLKLDRMASSDLKINKNINFSQSLLGYRLEKDNSLLKISPFEGWDWVEKLQDTKENEVSLSKPWRGPRHMTNWTVRDEAGNRSIWVSRDEIRIHLSELLRQEELLYDEIDIDGRSIFSKNLNLMNEAAVLFWGAVDVIFSERETHPSREKIVHWFVEQGVALSVAQVAATIITPDDANPLGRPSKTEPMRKFVKMSRKGPSTS